jgi:predicted transcriptional regulator
VITVSPEESLRSVAKHLADDDIGALVIVGSHGARGIISERDITRAVSDGIDLDDVPACDYMTESPVTVQMDAALGDAIAKMNEFGVRHLVVIEGDEDVEAVLSMRDVFAMLGSDWPEL